jgi:hypothetical protein
MVAAPTVAQAQDNSAQTFSQEQLDQMLAPIALYPDSLLSQVLMASTYPADVAEAVKWSKANPDQKGDAAVKAVQDKNWDPSVQSLTAFPQVLAMMGDKPDWVQTLGDAFLAQPDAVMDRVQFLRKKADAAGTLKSNEQQKVVTEQVPVTAAAPTAAQAPAPTPAEATPPASTQTIIKIEPANPQVVYVPAYNPTVVYGTWWYPSYPPFYWPPPPLYGFGSAVVAGIGFGIGVGITSALWGGFNWGHHDVDINVNRYNNINVNKQINASNTNVKWNHNAENRKGVPYRDAATREKFDKKVGGAENRQDFRGKDASRDAARDKASSVLSDRGADPGQGREKLQTVDRDKAREAAQRTQQGGGARAQQAGNRDAGGARAPQGSNRDSGGARAPHAGDRDSAFQGIGTGRTQDATARGAASRQSMQTHAQPQRASGAAHAGGGARPASGQAGGGGHAGGGRRR